MHRKIVLCLFTAALAATAGASAGEARSGLLCADGAHVAFATWGEGSDATLGIVHLVRPLGPASLREIPLGEPGPVKLACEGGRILVGTAAGTLSVSARGLEVSTTDRTVDFDRAVVKPIGCAVLESREPRRVRLSLVPELPLRVPCFNERCRRERFSVGTAITERESGGARVETEAWMRAGEVHRVLTLLDTECPPGGTAAPGAPPPGGAEAASSPEIASVADRPGS